MNPDNQNNVFGCLLIGMFLAALWVLIFLGGIAIYDKIMN